MQKRLPRFKRASNLSPFELGERDFEIIKLVHRHRFLRSNHIVSVITGSKQQIVRRLQLLFHHGYLERPRAQLTYYNDDTPRSIAYGLGKKGGEVLRRLGMAVNPHSWSEQNHSIGRVYLDHALMVADVMLAIELACRGQGVKLLYEEEVGLEPECRPLQWRVTIRGGAKLGIVPDRVFALEYANATGHAERAYFFLEADRGTMPVMRHTLSQTSFFRKLLAYEAIWTQGLHHQLGIPRFRVLTVTSIPGRVKSLVEACSQLQRGHGLFLFADDGILSGDIFSPLWHVGRPGEMGGLLG